MHGAVTLGLEHDTIVSSTHTTVLGLDKLSSIIFGIIGSLLVQEFSVNNGQQQLE